MLSPILMPAARPPVLPRPGDRLHPEIRRVIEALAGAAVRRENRRVRRINSSVGKVAASRSRPAMIPCALYLRYSSDRQNDRSPEDQEAVCRTYMERNGYVVAAVYVDRAKSGATVHERTDFQRILADAKSGLFQAVCAETTSRYGRDEEDRAAARKRLTFHGVTIMTPVDGVVSRLTDGIKAAIDAHQLEDLKVMIRRGMAGVIREGRHAGGSVYGYRTVPGLPGIRAGAEANAANWELSKPRPRSCGGFSLNISTEPRRAPSPPD